MRAHLRYYAKNYIFSQYIMELSIYEVGVSVRYPHINDLELSYEYENDDKLIKDFQRFVFENLGVRL